MREIESAAGRNDWHMWARVAPASSTPSPRRCPNTGVSPERERHGSTARMPARMRHQPTRSSTTATPSSRARPRSRHTSSALNPSLGLMHADQRYRGSLATDLMEPVRPITDSLVLDRLDSTICPDGTCTRNRERRVPRRSADGTATSDARPTVADGVGAACRRVHTNAHCKRGSPNAADKEPPPHGACS
jgi:hypothetical protein